MDVTKNDEIRDRLGKVTEKKEIYRPTTRALTTNGDISIVRADNMNQNQEDAKSRIESQRNEQLLLRRDLQRKLQFRQDKRRKQIMRQTDDANTRNQDDEEIKAMDDDDDEDTSLSTLSSATKTDNGNLSPGSACSDTEMDNANKERIPYFFEEDLEKVLALPDPDEERLKEEKQKRISMYRSLTSD